jgi:NurA domain
VSLEAARRAVEFLENNIIDDDLGEPHLKQTGVTTYQLVKQGFETISDRKSRRRLAFVDGGNQEIIGAPNFSVQLNRVYSSIWNGRQREQWKLPRVEFFSSTYSCFKQGEIHYETSVIPSANESSIYLPDAKDLSFDSLDRSLMNGNQRAGIERVGSVARRFSEWRLGLQVLEMLTEGDVLVMDGSLQSNYTNETKYTKALSMAAKNRGIILTGLSKTSTLFTTTGLSLIGAVSSLSEREHINGNWYFPVAEAKSIDHEVIITITKLNTLAERVFRFEVQRDQYAQLGKDGLDEIFSLLCQNSTDPTFPGYPYGLIDADRFARVSDDEVDYYLGLIMAHFTKTGKASKFLSHVHSGDAHDILNLLVK